MVRTTEHLLRSVPALAGCSPRELRRMAALMDVVTLRSGATLTTEGEFMRIQAATFDALTGDEKSEQVADAQASAFRQIGITKYEEALDGEDRVASFIHVTDAWQRGEKAPIPVMRVRISSVDAWTFGHASS